MLRKWFRGSSWRTLLNSFHWYRRWYGGVWEHWWVDSPVNSGVWHDVEAPWAETGERPSFICRGTPVVEDYRKLGRIRPTTPAKKPPKPTVPSPPTT